MFQTTATPEEIEGIIELPDTQRLVVLGIVFVEFLSAHDRTKGWF